MSGTFRLFILFLAVASSAGCTSGASRSAASDNAAAASDSVAAASASPVSASTDYPAWAAAAVPNYPNAIERILVRDDFYQIDSADDAATVLAWYKAHVSGTWTTAGSPDNALLPNVNGVRIEVDKLGYGNQPVGARPRTMVCLNRVGNDEIVSC